MQRQDKSGQFICYRVGQFYLLLTEGSMVPAAGLHRCLHGFLHFVQDG